MFECNADCLMNTVNCEGVMGKGIAYQFKMRFPENNKSYIKACKSGALTIDKVHFYCCFSHPHHREAFSRVFCVIKPKRLE